MSVRIKFGDCVPFPTGPGMWIRLVIADSPKNTDGREQSVVITQGHVMLFEGDKIMLMDQHQETTPETIHQGDQRCAADGLLVAYTPITGVGIKRRMNPQTNGQDVKPRVDMPPKIEPG